MTTSMFNDEEMMVGTLDSGFDVEESSEAVLEKLQRLLEELEELEELYRKLELLLLRIATEEYNENDGEKSVSADEDLFGTDDADDFYEEDDVEEPEDDALETLNHVIIDCLYDPDFYLILENFLDNMPSSRESVDEMLETVTEWDLWQVYYKLLTECEAFLTPEEHAKLKTDYKDKFSIPLPDESVSIPG